MDNLGTAGDATRQMMPMNRRSVTLSHNCRGGVDVSSARERRAPDRSQTLGGCVLYRWMERARMDKFSDKKDSRTELTHESLAFAASKLARSREDCSIHPISSFLRPPGASRLQTLQRARTTLQSASHSMVLGLLPSQETSRSFTHTSIRRTCTTSCICARVNLISSASAS